MGRTTRRNPTGTPMNATRTNHESAGSSFRTGEGTVPRVATAGLISFVADIFGRLGVDASGARVTAESLVAADVEGVPSHGVMLVPMYVDRIRAGSVTIASEAEVALDAGSMIVLDARNALGQISSHQAVRLVSERASAHGLAAVAVRNGFHFGMAGYWARALASLGHVGIVLSNTRPLMPAVGGAARIVGNNPLAIAMPCSGEPALLIDMALSASAMGKIRLAEAVGRCIPEGWAADAHGKSTTDPAAAIEGMLLPAAGPKGFGLAVMIDLLCGGLSGGAIGDAVRPLYGDMSEPYGCAHFFLAINPACFGAGADFAMRVREFADRIRGSKRAPGVERIYAPGDVEIERRAQNISACPVPEDVLKKLIECGGRLGVISPALAGTTGGD
jgi:LDH2 family malate/lactate/ureidoglycolate dehydrogenase